MKNKSLWIFFRQSDFDCVICTFLNPMLTIDTSKRKIHFRLIYLGMTSQTNTGCCYSYDTFQGLVNRYFSKLTPNFERKTLSTSCTHFQKYKSRYFQKRNQSGHQVTIWAGESTGSNKLIQPLVLFSRHKGIALKGMIICSVASWKSKI